MATVNTSKKAYIAPFAAFLLMLCAADLFGPSAKYWVYPLQTVICGIIILRFWPVYSFKAPAKPVLTIVTAVIVLFLWISPQELFHVPKRLTGFDPTIFRDQPFIYFATLAMRFLRLAIVVPFVEEIFWRGFALRYLVREDFETVPFGTFTWTSFLAVTAGFCVEHSFADWPAAILTGALYNLVAYRTRSLASCILAHGVTNLLLGIYIMYTGQWGFW